MDIFNSVREHPLESPRSVLLADPALPFQSSLVAQVIAFQRFAPAWREPELSPQFCLVTVLPPCVLCDSGAVAASLLCAFHLSSCVKFFTFFSEGLGRGCQHDYILM